VELFLQQVLAGIATGGIYACMALALVMIAVATSLLAAWRSRRLSS